MKRTIAAILIFATMLTAVNATATQAELDKELSDFAKQVADFVPRASTSTNLWADAHIGNLFPLKGLPHAGIGATAGGVLIPTSLMSTFSSAFSDPAKTWEAFPLPAISMDARIGGIILPFDIGVHALLLDNFEHEFWGMKVTIPTIFSYGGDVRLAILQEGVVLPALSIGVGYTYVKGEFDIESKDVLSVSNILSSASTVRSHMEYETNIYSATVQLSKKILIITPFVGAKAIAQDGTYKYGGSYTNVDGHTHTLSMAEVKKTFDFTDVSKAIKKLNYNVFAGVGLDFFIIQTTVGVNYDFTDKTWAGSASIHIKI